MLLELCHLSLNIWPLGGSFRYTEARAWVFGYPLVWKQMYFPYPGFRHQHVVPQDGGPTTWELADVRDHHNGQRGRLKDDKDLEIIWITEISPSDHCAALKLSEGLFVNLHIFSTWKLKMLCSLVHSLICFWYIFQLRNKSQCFI